LFIDDDVTLDRDYIKTISRYFEDHPEVDGVTGWIDTEYHRENVLKRLLRACVGAVLPSLVPASLFIPRASRGYSIYPVFRLPGTDSVPAEWLSGCNMAYRSSIFDEGYRFDERMEGYALGEDREFSNRLYHDGKQLRLVYGARLIHRRHP
jgi:GT2 family glycosyltransferase